MHDGTTPDLAPGTLLVLVGPAGAGKTTYARQFVPGTVRVSLDELRGRLADDESDQGATTDAVSIQHAIIDARLARGLLTVVDSTGLLAHARARLLAQARLYRRPCVAAVFATPHEECVRRNAERSRRVPPAVLADQYADLPTRDQLCDEGFDHVLTVVTRSGGRVATTGSKM
ncbi:AAA family ATPase [Streptomyces sp. NPDC049879]|uniref:AAA family ATPase n=1 Tax=Streptomyces sp. NPDC049879 TaxID=3365598 RepID=UPI0037BB72DE